MIMSTPKLLVSIVITTVLGFQLLAVSGLTPGPVERPPFLWPFLDYPMYSTPHYSGDTIDQPEVYGVLADSSEVEIEASDLGMNFWLFRRGLISGLSRDDTSQVHEYARLYTERTGEHLAGFRLYHRPLVLREKGVVRADRVLVEDFSLSAPARP